MTTVPILFLDHAAALGGAEYSLLLILKHINRERWWPHLACAPGQLAEKAQALGVSVHPVAYPRLRGSPHFLLDWLGGARGIARLAGEIGVRALYANTVRAALYAAPAARLAGVPFIWHMRDFWLSEARPHYLWADRLGKQLLVGSAARVITNSHAVAGHLPRTGKTSVVHNAIEIERLDPICVGQPFRAKYQISSGAPVVGVVGRLRPWKGQDRFLRAMASVAEQMPEAHFLIVGGEIFGIENDYEQELHQLAVELGLADRVIFTGQLADARPALAAMDVFVHPGDPEPFGLVNIEAMAMGKPVAAFGHGALPEIVVDGETGLLVPPGDEAALAAAVIDLLCTPDRRAGMGLAGRKRVEENFTMGRVTAEIDAILSEVIG
jgi:glycosyltransferase involved in cell wall biosynthesis